MPTSVKELLAAANAVVPRIGREEAAALIAGGKALVVDVRDAPEGAGGKIAGAVNVSRGMLEFRADPASPYHDAAFDPTRTIILYCASGGRSALAGKTLKDMGWDVRAISAASRTGPRVEVRSNRRRLLAGNRPAHRLTSLPRDTIGVGEMTSGQRFAGGCLCGGIRFVAEGLAYRVGLCHCLDCRKHGGAPFGSFAIFPAATVTFSGDELGVYASSAHGRRWFCQNCGCSLAATRAPTRSTCM